MSLDLAREIALAARVAGGRALIVGGWVRDRLRGHPSKDIDLEVFGIPQDHLAPLLAPFGRVEAVGQSFPVYKVVAKGEGELIDVALPRRESKSGRGHKGFEVVGDPTMTVEDAARRRRGPSGGAARLCSSSSATCQAAVAARIRASAKAVSAVSWAGI